ncbi:zonadhesin [Nephila pilipes]|uniref:Zonadhesin n=1 Tax=Nephila pilipes TaxID=299642 RepID=A0A8X6P3U1_NEPPI|nr:zonadhesin [Nephila pilipes]
MEIHLLLFLCLGFLLQEGLAQTGNVTVTCGEGEEYQPCRSCENTCEDPFSKRPCQGPCRPGCVCAKGFVRSRDRKCIRPQHCNIPTCGENEEFSECGSSCPLTCSNYQESIFCTKGCTKGCFCKSGYVEGPNKKCILPQNCPIGPCQPNEVASDCVNPCNTCSQRGKCFYEYCNRGCDCQPGCFRNSTGQCVPATKCDARESLCPKQEHYVPCINLCNDCWSRGDCEQTYCQPGCDCNPGLFRDDNGDCIPESQCISEEVACGINEEYTDCVNPCNDCIKQGNCQYVCQYGCDCKKGYFRDSKGVCIPVEQCSAEPGVETKGCRSCRHGCPLNEQFYICKPTCKTTCDNFNDTSAVCSIECNSGCFCKKGFVRGKDGLCVPQTECPRVCGLNEEFSNCGPACPATCSNFGKSVVCTQQCVKGCFCKNGFIRGPQGTCIKPETCPAECGENEVYNQCGPACPPTCITQGQPVSCHHECVRGCFCKPGFVRGPDGKCINPTLCPLVCGKNEEFLQCGSTCPASCGTLSNPRSLPCKKVCVRGCFCKPGFVRGSDGSCIPPTTCPTVCGANEEFKQCGTACPASCTNHTTPRPCPDICVKGCFCLPGYVRGPEGKCILPQSCPVACKEREEYMDCGPPCPFACEDMSKAPCSGPCIKGCFCKKGFVRGPKGKCIIPALCPPVCGKNEEFKRCGTPCPITCANLTSAHSASSSKECVTGCFCKPGYVRGPNNSCILPKDCPAVCGEHEEFKECGTACPTSCANLITPNVCRKQCVRGCFCVPGYIRGPDGKCILPQFCPLVCKENEEFKQCGSACPITCATVANPPAPCPLPCTRGCCCKPGFVRGPDGNCILPALCPVVCGAYEEFKECGTACPATCNNNTVTLPCPAICVKGCFCRDGYVRDPLGKCVLPTSCPVVCKENEEFKQCGSACPHTCDSLSRPPTPCTLQCVKGCFCKPGYVRDPTGKCILPNFCPVVCGENEEFLECGTACPTNCSNRFHERVCAAVCVKGCFCKKGFIRGPGGKCISPTLCPVVCKENEVFQQCGSACQRTCENLGKPLGVCTLQCVKGCFCKPGYVRNQKGLCVLPNFCPVVCGENEEFKECGTACPRTCSNRTEHRPCPAVCVKGCFCRDGYVRDPSGKCVLPRFCPVVCKVNEVFQECGPACPNTCDSLGKSDSPCPARCVKGCFCKSGYVRNRDGNCILPNFCPVGALLSSERGESPTIQSQMK